MRNEFGQFLKPTNTCRCNSQDTPLERRRIDFRAVEERCPELADRVVFIRSRVYDLRRSFHEDSERALEKFILTLWVGVGVAVGIIASALLVQALAQQNVWATAVFATAMGTIAGVGAVTRTLGWHSRYKAMFHARWAMDALAIEIDDLVHDIALEIAANDTFDDAQKLQLRRAKDSWLELLKLTLAQFGENYGSALEPLDIKRPRA